MQNDQFPKELSTLEQIKKDVDLFKDIQTKDPGELFFHMSKKIDEVLRGQEEIKRQTTKTNIILFEPEKGLLEKVKNLDDRLEAFQEKNGIVDGRTRLEIIEKDISFIKKFHWFLLTTGLTLIIGKGLVTIFPSILAVVSAVNF
jgi:glycyl-tRNA synthetase beta subunit